MPSAKYTLKASSDRIRFKKALMAVAQAAWTEKPEQYCDYRLDGKAAGGWMRAKQFSNGTLYLEAASEPLLGVMQALLSDKEPVASGQTRLPLASSNAHSAATRGLLDIQGAYIGTDESGKGDYFGPLVIAGVYVTDQTCAILKELGVMDSKKLSEKDIEQLQRDVLATVGSNSVSIVEIGPAKYNELYQRFKNGGKNLNHLLAWGHATVIENLLLLNPDCKQAIADQFGNERYILSQLKEKGKGITLYQTHKAEANVGVAAASILARYRFTQKIHQLSQRFGIRLPLGANPAVKQAARAVIEAHGRPALTQVAKLHFKTTEEL